MRKAVARVQAKVIAEEGHPGRPAKPISYDTIRRAASIGCSIEELAVMAGLSRSNFSLRLKEDDALLEAIERGRAAGQATLRRLQWQQAKAGNPTMLIWLGKQLLGQRDVVETEHSGDHTVRVEIVQVPAAQAKARFEIAEIGNPASADESRLSN